eukprot:g13159.t1
MADAPPPADAAPSGDATAATAAPAAAETADASGGVAAGAGGATDAEPGTGAASKVDPAAGSSSTAVGDGKKTDASSAEEQLSGAEIAAREALLNLGATPRVTVAEFAQHKHAYLVDRFGVPPANAKSNVEYRQRLWRIALSNFQVQALSEELYGGKYFVVLHFGHDQREFLVRNRIRLLGRLGASFTVPLPDFTGSKTAGDVIPLAAATRFRGKLRMSYQDVEHLQCLNVELWAVRRFGPNRLDASCKVSMVDVVSRENPRLAVTLSRTDKFGYARGRAKLDFVVHVEEEHVWTVLFENFSMHGFVEVNELYERALRQDRDGMMLEKIIAGLQLEANHDNFALGKVGDTVTREMVRVVLTATDGKVGGGEHSTSNVPAGLDHGPAGDSLLLAQAVLTRFRRTGW